MNLHSGESYWYLKNGLINTYPSLAENIRTEVLIIGAGISGALTAYYLIKNGIDVTLIDKRDVASGSTSVSTSLIQYEIDTSLSELTKKVGKKNAFMSYLLCRDSIYTLQKIAKEINRETSFEIKTSLYLASHKKDFSELKNEFILRKSAGINVSFLDENELRSQFNLDAPAAIASTDGAQIDAYRFTHDLLKWVKNKGGNIYDKTEALKISHSKNDVTVTTDGNCIIKASHLIYANGYEAQNYLDENYGRLHSTYVVATEQLKQRPFDFIMWETSRPYMYIRTTADNRIIAGGKDEVFYSPGKRDILLPKKTKQILEAIKQRFPALDIKPDYSWTGTFAETKDGLPYIGKHKDHPHSYFSLGYGGNGITFSLIGAQIITDEITKKKNRYKNIFSFNR